MYVDKLDGKILDVYYEEKVQEWQEEQAQILKQIECHQKANVNYLNEGIRILELVNKAYFLYKQQNHFERGKLLNFILQNCTYIDGNITPTYRKPFDLLVKTSKNSDWGE